MADVSYGNFDGKITSYEYLILLSVFKGVSALSNTSLDEARCCLNFDRGDPLDTSLSAQVNDLSALIILLNDANKIYELSGWDPMTEPNGASCV